MIERVSVWECIGCGRIEGAQPCIGVCQDRRAEFVRAADHDDALGEAQRHIDALTAVVRQIVFTTPRTGECERTWHALQDRAREALKGAGQTP